MPAICQNIKIQYEQIKTLKNEFVLAYEKAIKTRSQEDRNEARILQNKLIAQREALQDLLWPFEAITKQEIKKQYDEQFAIMQKIGIIEKLSNGKMGIIDIKGRECPIPALGEVEMAMKNKENKEILKTKIEQGFAMFQLTPFGMSLDKLIDKYKDQLWRHCQEKKLFATMENPSDTPKFPDDLPFDQDTINKIKSGELKYEDVWKKTGDVYKNENSALWVWDKYKNADKEGRMLYYPEKLPTVSEEPNEAKRNALSKGKTKEDLLAGELSSGWNIIFREDLPNIPRKDKGKEINGRPQLDTAGTSIKKYIKSGENIPSPQEYLEAIKNEPIYQNEQGMTPEDQAICAIIHLEKTNQVIDDFQGNGSISYQIGAYIPASGFTPYARCYRDVRQAFFGGSGSAYRLGDCGVRSVFSATVRGA